MMQKYPQQGAVAQQQGGSRPGQGQKGRERDKFIRTNWKIRNKYSRLIEDGKPPRMMPTAEALEIAQSQGLDLIEIGYDRQNDCSNVIIRDYGKYIYDKKRREKEAKKQARANQTEVKTVQISLTIDTADMERMVERAKGFLADGDRVKISLRFRGRREMSQMPLARETIKGMLSRFDGIAVLDSTPQMNGKELGCIIRPVRKQS